MLNTSEEDGRRQDATLAGNVPEESPSVAQALTVQWVRVMGYSGTQVFRGKFNLFLAAVKCFNKWTNERTLP
jgi:hypothetical protein